MLWQIPGYLEAASRERVVRDAAFLPVGERIGRFEIAPLTVRRYLLLRIAQSPLLIGAPASRYDVGNFLWMLSKSYSPKSKFRRFYFLRFSCRMLSQRKVLIAVTKKCRAIAENAIIDCAASTGGGDKSFFSDIAFLCWRLREWLTEEQVMEMPMARIMQYVKIADFFEYKRILDNPFSDGVIAKWQKSQQPKSV